MSWNWELHDWPEFTWENGALTSIEQKFLEQAGVVIGASRHLGKDEKQDLEIELMSSEAVSTSAIEGEVLDRDSVQSSIRKQLGLAETGPKGNPAEAGIAEMTVDLYRTVSAPLTHETLFEWHRMLLNGRRDIADIGGYRTHEDPMQIVSGPIHKRRVHFEAPPSSAVAGQMTLLIDWFNRTTPNGKAPPPAITRAGIAHIWFESIHPFEDGNGRLGRAISEKALAQATSVPQFTALAGTLLRHRKEYYAALEAASKTLDVNEWLSWFGNMTLEAQTYTRTYIEFLIAKSRVMDSLRGKLNERQEKALLRMFQEGPEGFTGGLSAGNYASITGATPATTTRDLVDLVDKGALRRVGERKSTRYHLVIS